MTDLTRLEQDAVASVKLAQPAPAHPLSAMLRKLGCDDRKWRMDNASSAQITAHANWRDEIIAAAERAAGALDQLARPVEDAEVQWALGWCYDHGEGRPHIDRIGKLINRLASARAQAEADAAAMRASLEDIRGQCPKTDPGPARDEFGYHSYGNADDVARDVTNEALWDIAQKCDAALASDAGAKLLAEIDTLKTQRDSFQAWFNDAKAAKEAAEQEVERMRAAHNAECQRLYDRGYERGLKHGGETAIAAPDTKERGE